MLYLVSIATISCECFSFFFLRIFLLLFAIQAYNDRIHPIQSEKRQAYEFIGVDNNCGRSFKNNKEKHSSARCNYILKKSQ